LSQQILQMGNSTDPGQASAQAAAEAAALKAGEGVQITSTVVGADGVKRTDFQQTPGTPAQPAQQPTQDNLILGKFKTQDDLVKAYTELEKKLGAPPQQQTQQPTQNQQSLIDKAAAEYAADHKISDETIAALEKQGIPRSTVDNYVAGVQALEAQQEAAAFALVGGKDSYGKMIEWAATNLSESEIAAYDAAVTHPATAEMAIKGLHARFQQTGTFEPGRALNGNNNAAGGDMFRSRHEMMAAMKDERYTKGDMAFHAEVQAKIANAMRAGIDIYA
jgi:hypothetical protein